VDTPESATGEVLLHGIHTGLTERWGSITAILDRGVPYDDMGADYFTTCSDPQRAAARLTRQLSAPGYRVTLDPVEAA